MRFILLFVLVILLGGGLAMVAGYAGRLKTKNTRLREEMVRQAAEKVAKTQSDKKQ